MKLKKLVAAAGGSGLPGPTDSEVDPPRGAGLRRRGSGAGGGSSHGAHTGGRGGGGAHTGTMPSMSPRCPGGGR